MDGTKTKLILNIIRFLNDERSRGDYDANDIKSIDDIIATLKKVFKIEEKLGPTSPQDIPDVEDTAVVRAEDETEADRCKSQGNIFMTGGNWDLALKEYTKAIKLNPQNPIYYCNRAAAYNKLDRPMNAIIDCKSAIKLDPKYSKAYGRMGNAYWTIGLSKEAHEAYNNALKYDPNNETYRENLKRVSPVTQNQNQNDFAPMMEIVCQLMQEDSFQQILDSITTAYENTSPPFLNKLMELGVMVSNRLHASDINQQIKDVERENKAFIKKLENPDPENQKME